MTRVHRLPIHATAGAPAGALSAVSAGPEAPNDAPRMGAPAVVSEAPTEELLRVGDLARACGKTVRAIHHYENLGLLQPVRRSKGRYRLYAPDAVDRVRWIGKLNDVGMSLSEIHEVLSRWEQGPSAPEAMSKVRQVYRDKLAEVSRQIQHLESLAHELQASLNYLETCASNCDPTQLVGACSCCQNHDPQTDEPALVAGLYAGAPVEALSAE